MSQLSSRHKQSDQLQPFASGGVGGILNRPNVRRILVNISWLLSERLLRLAVGLVVGVWIARYLGPDQFGVLSYAVALAMMFGNVAGLGLDSIVVRDLVRNIEGRRATLGTAFVLKALAGIIAGVLVVATVTVLRRDDGPAKIAAAIMALALAFKAFDVIQFWFESQVQSKFVVWSRNAAFGLVASVNVVLILNRQSVLSFVWSSMAEIIIGAVGLLIVYRLAGGHASEWRVSGARAKRLLENSWPLMLSTAAVMVYMRIDTIMIGSMIDDRAVGVYSAAVRISELWYFVPVAVVASVFPSLLKAKESSQASYERRFAWLYDLMSWFGLGLAVFITPFSHSLILLLYGESYADAAGVLSIHIWAGAFVFLGVASEKWFIAENLTRLTLFRTLLGAVVNVALNLVLIPKYGMKGAAVATLAAQAAACYGFDVFFERTRAMFFVKTRSLLLVSSVRRIHSMVSKGSTRS